MNSTAANMKEQATDFVKAQVDTQKQQLRGHLTRCQKQLPKDATTS